MMGMGYQQREERAVDGRMVRKSGAGRCRLMGSGWFWFVFWVAWVRDLTEKQWYESYELTRR